MRASMASGMAPDIKIFVKGMASPYLVKNDIFECGIYPVHDCPWRTIPLGYLAAGAMRV